MFYNSSDLILNYLIYKTSEFLKMKMFEIVEQQKTLNAILEVAKFECPECGIIHLENIYVAFNRIVCCNLCGSEILK